MIKTTRAGKKTRAQRRRDNLTVFWQAKYDAAITPEEKAIASWDHLRRIINDLPPQQQGEAWMQLATTLVGLQGAVSREDGL